MDTCSIKYSSSSEESYVAALQGQSTQYTLIPLSWHLEATEQFKFY